MTKDGSLRDTFVNSLKNATTTSNLDTLFPVCRITTNKVNYIFRKAICLEFILSEGKQSNALDRSMRMTASWSTLFKALRHSSEIARSTDW